jgi:hypothetical protein
MGQYASSIVGLDGWLYSSSSSSAPSPLDKNLSPGHRDIYQEQHQEKMMAVLSEMKHKREVDIQHRLLAIDKCYDRECARLRHEYKSWLLQLKLEQLAAERTTLHQRFSAENYQSTIWWLLHTSPAMLSAIRLYTVSRARDSSFHWSKVRLRTVCLNPFRRVLSDGSRIYNY